MIKDDADIYIETVNPTTQRAHDFAIAAMKREKDEATERADESSAPAEPM